MDDPDTQKSSASGSRTFKLTPRTPGKPRTAPASGRGSKSRRNVLIGGSAAMPFITTIGSRSALAGSKKVSASMAASSGGGKKTGSLQTPGGDSVVVWQQNYPKLIEHHRLEANAFPAALARNSYLSNPSLASVFTVPRDAVDGVTLTAPEVDLRSALHGHGTWEIAVSHNGETARRTMDGGFFAEATAAVLNAAVYGQKSFGMTDAKVIEHVNETLANLPVKARTLAALKADASAAEILEQLAGQIEGSFATRGEIHYFARMNTRGVA